MIYTYSNFNNLTMCTIVHNVFVSQMFLKDKSKLTDYKSK